MTFEYKNEFVDDNPYLVYSPKAETTSEGGSGGGGGVPFFEISAEGEIQLVASEFMEILNKGIANGIMSDSALTSDMIAMGYMNNVPSEGNVTFHIIVVQNGDVAVLNFVALDANSKPVLSMG